MTHIGIDGGGTKTRLIVQVGDEEPRYFEYPVSLKVQNGDYSAAAKKLSEIISEAIVGVNGINPFPATIKPSPAIEEWANAICPYIAIGLSGMSQPDDQELLRNEILSQPKFATSKIHIESDATLTLKSVLAEGEEGILLIAGTGSVVFYQPSGGAPRRIGGWGPILSDEGSGYRIGLRALRQYVNVLDGVFPRDAFSEAIETRLAAYGVEPTPRSIAVRAQNDVTFVASFAQDAFETAPNLRAIQDLIHEELVDLVTLVFRLFLPGVMSGNTPYRLYLAGRIAQQPMTLRAFEMAFEDTDIEFRFVSEQAPAMKALEIARTLG